MSESITLESLRARVHECGGLSTIAESLHFHGFVQGRVKPDSTAQKAATLLEDIQDYAGENHPESPEADSLRKEIINAYRAAKARGPIVLTDPVAFAQLEPEFAKQVQIRADDIRLFAALRPEETARMLEGGSGEALAKMVERKVLGTMKHLIADGEAQLKPVYDAIQAARKEVRASNERGAMLGNDAPPLTGVNTAELVQNQSAAHGIYDVNGNKIVR